MNEKAIEIIESSKKTHEDWLAYFEKYPDMQSRAEYKSVGSMEHHKKCIEGYNYVLAELKSQAKEIKRLEGFCVGIGKKEKTASSRLIIVPDKPVRPEL